MSMAPATTAIMTSLPLGKAGVGSAANDTTRELGGALGVAVLGSLVASHHAPSIAKVPGFDRAARSGRPVWPPGVARRRPGGGGVGRRPGSRTGRHRPHRLRRRHGPGLRGRGRRGPGRGRHGRPVHARPDRLRGGGRSDPAGVGPADSGPADPAVRMTAGPTEPTGGPTEPVAAGSTDPMAAGRAAAGSTDPMATGPVAPVKRRGGRGGGGGAVHPHALLRFVTARSTPRPGRNPCAGRRTRW